MAARLNGPRLWTRSLHVSASRLQAYQYPYDVAALEAKWIKAAQSSQMNFDRPVSAAGSKRKKFYILSMFPYPSGNMHMGHVRVYTISDMLARFRRMQGYDVLHPMGWDAFGLPAENAAIERNISPHDWTLKNIQQMKEQLSMLATEFDWAREITTCDPSYYKHTQSLFLKLLDAGMAYRKEAMVNWDPIDQTVLANEQVDAKGRSWRSGAIVERKKLRQWFLKTTAYVEDLLQDLDHVNWPEKVKQMQRNWIGKSEGLIIPFSIITGNGNTDTTIQVFTTRPETVFGVTFLAIGPGHDLLNNIEGISTQQSELLMKENTRYAEQQQQNVFINKTELEKAGINTGIMARNPFTGESVPVYLTNYVVSDYGTGTVMGVPAHDERDWDFAIRHDIPIRMVIESNQVCNSTMPFVDQGTMSSACHGYEGLLSDDARAKMLHQANCGEISAKTQCNYRLRDWLISRQRYWGAPIPVIHCSDCGVVPVRAADLPVLLPVKLELTGKGQSPLASLDTWVNSKCPKCGGDAKRDTDTMDTFVDSSWYFFRYTDPHNKYLPFDYDRASSLLPVDLYVGGIEHAILHLLYARFFTKFVSSVGLASVERGEPFQRLLTQGMVHGRTLKDPLTERYLRRDEVDLTGQPPLITYEKMSKSKHNGVSPEETIADYGADVMRLYIISKAAPEDVLEWDDQAIIGIARWISRLWRLVESRKGYDQPLSNAPTTEPQSEEEKSLWSLTHQCIKEITHALKDSHTLNTIPSHLIKLVHGITDFQESNGDNCISAVYDHSLRTVIQLMAPIAPCMGQELWERLCSDTTNPSSVFAEWPTHEQLSVELSTCVIQVNGKTRGVIEVPVDKIKDVMTLAKESDVAQRWLTGKSLKKTIVVKDGKIINFVA